MQDSSHDSGDEIVHKERSSFVTLVAVVTAIALILLSVQAYFYLIHPQPVSVPGLAEVSSLLDGESQEPFSSHRPDAVKRVVEANRNEIKQVANYIAAKSCTKADRVCQSRALFQFVRDEIKYVPDENFHDQLESPTTVLKTGGADCEDMAVLLIALQKAIGNQARLVFVPGHAYAQVSIPGYRSEKWLNLEATCKDCQFGELPNNTAMQKKTYVEI